MADLSELHNQVVLMNNAILDLERKLVSSNHTVGAQAQRIVQLEGAVSRGAGAQSAQPFQRHVDHKLLVPEPFKDDGHWREFAEEVILYIKGISRELCSCRERGLGCLGCCSERGSCSERGCMLSPGCI